MIEKDAFSWHDLVGEMIAVTQEEALERDRAFVATTPYQHLLRRFINREISSLSVIYALLRMELVHQAAAHIRLFCENVITLRYILLDSDKRSKAFLDYAALDAYKIRKAYLQWESQTAKPQYVEAMSLQQAELEKRFAEVCGRYTYVDRKKKPREFKNWCNLTLKNQVDECGAEMQKREHGQGWGSPFASRRFLLWCALFQVRLRALPILRLRISVVASQSYFEVETIHFVGLGQGTFSH